MMPTISTPLEIKLYEALKRIASYQTAERVKKRSFNDWGLDDGNEALEYAYENMQLEAKRAIKGVRLPKPKATQSTAIRSAGGE